MSNPDDLDAIVERAQRGKRLARELERQAKRLAYWQGKYTAAAGIVGKSQERGQANRQVSLVREKIEQLEQEAASMRRHLDEPQPSGKPGNGQVLIANRTITQGERTYHRGQEVDPAILQTLNGPQMLRSGALFWGHKRPGPIARLAPVAKAFAPPPFPQIRLARSELRRVAAMRNTDLISAEDMVDVQVMAKARVELSEQARAVVATPPFGEQATSTVTGFGSSRRVIDDFGAVMRCDAATFEQYVAQWQSINGARADEDRRRDPRAAA